jgi:uncharacterized protein (DUF58 family)
VTRTYSPKLGLYGTFAGLAFLLAIVLGRPELAALGAPFAVYLLLALSLSTPPGLRATFTLDRERVVEGDALEAVVEVVSESAAEVELLVGTPAGVALAADAAHTVVHAAAGEPRPFGIELTATRWGAYLLGELAVRARDRFGLVAYTQVLEPSVPLRVYPRAERLQSLARPLETQPYAGNRVARTQGDGIEFADIRPFAPGDRVRRINWRVSARRQALYVNESHPERNSDVVLFLDAFAQLRGEADGTLDLAVRAAATLAHGYLEERDRVGIVSFGGVVRWLTPSLGRRQLQRIVETLLETEVSLSYSWKGIDVLPPRSLPPQALVIALSPLLDERTIDALLDLRARGFDLVVVDVSPLRFAPPARKQVDRLAHRLWQLWRDALRYRYERLGIAVVEWDDAKPLAQVFEEVRAFRRYARRVSV